MIQKDALQYLCDLANSGVIHQIGGIHYSADNLQPVFHDPRPETIRVTTLRAIADYLSANVEAWPHNELIMRITPDEVVVAKKYEGPTAKRTAIISATPNYAPFVFRTPIALEEFIISSIVLFEPTKDLELIQKYCQTIEVTEGITCADDGVSQNIVAKVGVATREKVTIPKKVRLKPIRTFTDIGDGQQVESDFLFRMFHTKEGAIKAALYDYGGNLWKHEACEKIRKWFDAHENLTDICKLC